MISKDVQLFGTIKLRGCEVETFFATVRSLQWNELRFKKQKFAALLGTALLVALLASIWPKAIILTVMGAAWHFFHPESASAFWIGLGTSNLVAQALAVAFGLAWYMATCWFTFYGPFPYLGIGIPKHAAWIASRPLVKKLPYLGIVVFGLCLPGGGFLIGVAIACILQLPKAPATAVILTANLIKLCYYGKLTLFATHSWHIVGFLR